MADDYTKGFDSNVTVQSSDKFQGDFKEAASAAFEIGDIEEEILTQGGIRTDEGFILGTDGRMAYITDPDFLKIDRMIKYITSVLKSGLTQAFWADNVIPPLRTAFRDIFSKQGPKDWKPNTKGTAIFKAAFGLKSSSRITGGLSRPQHFTGAYRGALVVTKALWNRKGNLFVPLSDEDNISKRFSELYSEAGIDAGDRWSKGFTWGIDLPYFSEHARKFWEGVRKHVDNKRDITPKEVEGTSRRVRILKWFYRQELTEQNEINDFFREREQQGALYPFFMEEGGQRTFAGKGYNVDARPVFGYFRTDNPITRNFYRKVEKNMMAFLRKNLSKGARDDWYGGPGRIAKSDSPLRRFQQPFQRGSTAVTTGRMTADRDITRDDVRMSQVEQEAIRGEEVDAEALFGRHAAGEALSSDEYLSLIKHSVELAEGGGLQFTQREMAGQLNIPTDDIEFDDE